MSRAARSGGLRTDIQGLRAVAVALVLGYHVAPTLVPGGFVGVDAFFVISGFLITGHLLAHPPSNGRDLAQFWSRRIRRLLPASMLVLVSTLLASRLLAPETQWANTARQVREAALYVVNWRLAADSVDYLAAESAASPVQHFWSLSVEEQFYVFWPLLLFALVGFARLRWRGSGFGPQYVVGCGIGLVVAVSLTWSVLETASNPAAAYFVTPTRIWELGAGGLLALMTAPDVLGRSRPAKVPPRLVALLLAWGGLLALGVSAWAYSSATSFPGWAALLPVLGTGAVILGSPSTDPASPGPAMALGPVQWLGDVSYSVYLWHWPLLVFVPEVSSGSLGPLDRVAIILATLVLAGLTKTFVEDRFRTAEWGTPLRKPYLSGSIAMLLVVGLCAAALTEVGHRDQRARVALREAVARHDPCFGARALDPGRVCPSVPYAAVVPAPALAVTDKSEAYGDVSGRRDCWSYTPDFPQVRCFFGDPTAQVRVVLIGNSHAGQWLPALEILAREHHWRIETRLASRCASAETAQVFRNPAWSRSCLQWVTRTARSIASEHPDLVVMTNRVSVAAVGNTRRQSGAAYRRGYAAVLSLWSDAGIRTLVLRDTPTPLTTQIPDCVAEHRDHYRACDGRRSVWLRSDPAQRAAKGFAGDSAVTFLDLTDHICGPRTCAAVTGGVITYFDASHLTATYAATLAPYLEPTMLRLLGG